VLINLPKPRTLAARAGRPPREELEPVALDLIRRYGGDIMAVARRYSANREDAEDAYQRGLEILLTKAPSTSADVLVPWLKTVVKHEAYSLHRARERAGQATAPELLAGAASGAGAGGLGGAGAGAAGGSPHEQAERLERLQIGAEALGRLKPAEIRCMLLLAEGHSYRQICDITGFSYTKVNRCLTEGRRSFLQRVERIETGAECERLAPLLSALADGEATARDMALLRPHLRSCLSCRAALRDARAVPARVAALAPLGLLAGGMHGAAGGVGGVGGSSGGGWLGAGGMFRSAGDWLGERVAALSMRGHDLLEVASSHKLAAAAASAAALGGGGIATVQVTGPHGGGGGGSGPGGTGGRPPAHVVSGHRPPVAAPPAWRPAAATVPPQPLRRGALAAPHEREPRRRRKPRHEPRAGTREPSTVPQPPVAPQPEPRATAGPAPGAIEPAGPSGPPERRAQAPSTAGPQTGEFGP
jgi:RNA polymerase sigma factor (sigma-70 family)